MSRERMRGTFYVYPELPPVPDGYMSAPELLNDLLPVWWGERAYLGLITLFGHEVGERADGNLTKLGEFEQQGQLRGAANKIIENAKNQRIRFFVASEHGEVWPLSFMFWHAADPEQLRSSLCAGVVRAGKDGPASWAEGKALCLREEHAQSWLSAVQTTHEPPTRDDAEARFNELWRRRKAALEAEDWRVGVTWRDRDQRELEMLIAQEAVKNTQAVNLSMRRRTAGRPNITGPAADAYQELFPNGHGDLKWREVLERIAAHTGKKYPPDRPYLRS